MVHPLIVFHYLKNFIHMWLKFRSNISCFIFTKLSQLLWSVKMSQKWISIALYLHISSPNFYRMCVQSMHTFLYARCDCKLENAFCVILPFFSIFMHYWRPIIGLFSPNIGENRPNRPFRIKKQTIKLSNFQSNVKSK